MSPTSPDWSCTKLHQDISLKIAYGHRTSKWDEVKMPTGGNPIPEHGDKISGKTTETEVGDDSKDQKSISNH